MPRIADVLERESRTVDLERGDFERLLDRRDRKQRNRRIRAGAVGVIVALATVAVLARSMTSEPEPAIVPTPTPTPSPTEAPTRAEPVWPQSSLEEAQQAQELADARDPRYTWQVSPNGWYQPGQNHPMNGEFFARFLEEELGWEAFLWTEAFAHRDGLVGGDVLYVRCVPDGTNPLYPDDPEGGCEPTIDGLRYETVKIHVDQPVRPEEPSGIWVVTGWEMIEPAEQVVPLADGEIAALLEPFLRARIDGAGAEGSAEIAEDDEFADVRIDREIPLLYATSTGAPYERSEFEIVEGPVWPEGQMRVVIRLFAQDDQTAVEQVFSLDRDEAGRARLVYDLDADGPEGRGLATTENGVAPPVEYGFLDGEVTYRATSPAAPSVDTIWDQGPGVATIVDARERRLLLLLADPRPIGPGCEVAPAPDDAAALAERIRSDSDFETDAPVPVTIGGVAALQMDVVLARGASSCSWRMPSISSTTPLLLKGAPLDVTGADRARLYLIDLPPGGSARVLAVAIMSDEDSFEHALRVAVPIVESIAFRAP